MAKLVSGQIDKLCVRCSGGIRRMKQLRYTNTWICQVCSGTEYYTPSQASEEWLSEREELAYD